MAEKKERNSNLELYRIIVMLLIICHHYVVNSGVLEELQLAPFSGKSIFLYLFGGFGKIGINCFVLITGYFMCTSRITLRKFAKLLLEILFYCIVIYFIFIVTGYDTFSLKTAILDIVPIHHINSSNFVSCYLIFYLCIPFLNIVISNINEKQHLGLLAVLIFTYVLLGTVPKNWVVMNYISWFIVLYLIASYIRLYPKKIFGSLRVWLFGTIIFVALDLISIIACLHTELDPYSFVSDSNTFLAVATGVSSFLLFKNLKIKNNKVINAIASSTFGVLLIHANSDTMRQWLWRDIVNVCGNYSAGLWSVIGHAIISVIAIFIVCVIIDQIRIHTIEKWIFKWLDKINLWKYERIFIDGKR